MKRVLIVQATLPEYRVPFFLRLQQVLADLGIALNVAYGIGPNSHIRLEHPLGIEFPNRSALGGRVTWHPVLGPARDADLVIVEQANKHLVNYVLMLKSALGRTKIAFWGHGLVPGQRGAAAAWKRFWLNRADWWFAYTPGTRTYLVGQGFPAAQITTVDNSNDVAAFRATVERVGDDALGAARAELGIGDDAFVGLYCGSMYKAKAMPLLLETAHYVKSRCPDFHLVVVGDGADGALVRSAADATDFIHYLGALYGAARAVYFRLADVLLHPGVIGLAVLDAFAAGKPVITTDVAAHGPEIEYLRPGVNGLVTLQAVEAFGDAVLTLAEDRRQLRALGENARQSSHGYGIVPMAENFSRGITACLNGADNPTTETSHG